MQTDVATPNIVGHGKETPKLVRTSWPETYRLREITRLGTRLRESLPFFLAFFKKGLKHFWLKIIEFLFPFIISSLCTIKITTNSAVFEHSSSIEPPLRYLMGNSCMYDSIWLIYMRQQVRTEKEIYYNTCCIFFMVLKPKKDWCVLGILSRKPAGEKAWGELFKIINMLGKGYDFVVGKKC